MNTPAPLDAIPLPHLADSSFTLPNGWNDSTDVFTHAEVKSYARLAVTEALAAQAAAQPTAVASGVEVEWAIAAALRQHGLTLLKTASGYEVDAMGPATASTAPVNEKGWTEAEHRLHVACAGIGPQPFVPVATAPAEPERHPAPEAAAPHWCNYEHGGTFCQHCDAPAVDPLAPAAAIPADVAKKLKALAKRLNESAFAAGRADMDDSASTAHENSLRMARQTCMQKMLDAINASTTQAAASVGVVPLKESHHLWSHPRHSPRIARPSEATFAHGEPEWVREYPVEVYGPAQGSASDEGEAA